MKKSTITWSLHTTLILAILCICLNACHNENDKNIHDENLKKALEYSCFRHLLDSAVYYENLIDSTKLCDEDKQYYDILLCCIYSKRHGRVIDIDKIEKSLDFCLQNEEYFYAGEAAYAASVYYHFSDKIKMTRYSKEAEHYYSISGKDAPVFQITNIYLSIAYSLMKDNMHEESNEYALKALQYAEQDDDPYVFMEAYRMLLYNASDTTSVEKIKEIHDKAIYYARQLSDSIMLYDIEHCYENKYTGNRKRQMEAARNSHAATLAYDVAEYYLDLHETDSAEKYINIFAIDTARSFQIKEKYHELKARLLHERKKDTEAFNQLFALHQSIQDRLDNTKMAGTYVTVRHYDEMYKKEDELKKQAKIERHKIFVVALIVVLILAFAIAVLWILYYKKQNRFQQLENENEKAKHLLAMQQEQIERDKIESRLQSTQEILREKLKQRLDITKRLQIDYLKGHTTESLPQWMSQLLNDYTFTDGRKWQEFRREYNNATNNELDKLLEEYPSLTENDLQYIALSRMGLSVEEMCILLGATNRTIWNRKQIVKTKLGIAGNSQRKKHSMPPL